MTFNLKETAQIIESKTGHTATVKNIYKDFGQGTRFDMVVVGSDMGGYQALNFKEQKLAEQGLMTIEGIEKVVNEIIKRGW